MLTPPCTRFTIHALIDSVEDLITVAFFNSRLAQVPYFRRKNLINVPRSAIIAAEPFRFGPVAFEVFHSSSQERWRTLARAGAVPVCLKSVKL